jgi:hypothetical protein
LPSTNTTPKCGKLFVTMCLVTAGGDGSPRMYHGSDGVRAVVFVELELVELPQPAASSTAANGTSIEGDLSKHIA